MPAATPIFSKATFQFLRDLKRNNRTEWMHAHRERYQQELMQPVRELLVRIAPAVQKIAPATTISGMVNTNFSRINRDIRFAKDKSPYRARMYVMLPDGSLPETDEICYYVGVHPDEVTMGIRAYSLARDSHMRTVIGPRALAHSKWLAAQSRKLDRKYESYWHATEKGEWAKHPGWPTKPEEWKRIGAWIIRRVTTPAAATRAGFEREVMQAFRDLAPLYRFITAKTWKA